MPVGVPHAYNCPRARDDFLTALAATGSVRGAIRATGQNCRHVYRARARFPAFAAAWAALMPPTAAWRTVPRASAKAGWQDRVIVGLATTGNIRRAARIAGVSIQLIEQEREKDGAFALVFYEALHDGRLDVLLTRVRNNGTNLDAAFRAIVLDRIGDSRCLIRPKHGESEPEAHPLCPAATLRVPGKPRRRVKGQGARGSSR